jgi:hypothetical protein
VSLRKTLILTLILASLLGGVAWITVSLKKTRSENLDPVAGAQSRLNNALTNLNRTAHAVESANAFVRGVGVTNTVVNEGINSLGSTAVKKMMNNVASAAVDLELAQVGAVADTPIRAYAGLNQAREASAALILSGIRAVVIKPEENPVSKDGQLSYKILVSRELAERATEILNSAATSQLQVFDDPIRALSIVRMLEQGGVRAALIPLENSKPGEIQKNRYAVYVRLVDIDSAKSLIAGETTSY